MLSLVLFHEAANHNLESGKASHRREVLHRGAKFKISALLWRRFGDIVPTMPLTLLCCGVVVGPSAGRNTTRIFRSCIDALEVLSTFCHFGMSASRAAKSAYLLTMVVMFSTSFSMGIATD